ncbi:hypothetical protein OIU84_012469 [Salix udensis]|uniref:Uncharacterized protein n=1 Tax=Salix udensis TaxID=889485 RepID=A0AAD6NTC2_9ROSI|nr:hypothetical protein OIU84_012469 [Salix udensis]
MAGESFNNNVWVNRLAKSFKIDKSVNRLKPRRCLSRFDIGNGINFGDGFVKVLAASQTTGEAGMKWFEGTTNVVRQFTWVLEPCIRLWTGEDRRQGPSFPLR